MALTKVIGTETEYGVIIRHKADFNAALASALVVNSYPGPRVQIQWSHEEESPGRDARGFGHEGFGVADPDSALVNSVLGNGARLYVDHAHPEFSGPECADPRTAALYDVAGEQVMLASLRSAQTGLPAPQELRLFKNNSDGKGNSYGSHENYLLDRLTPFGQIIKYATTFLVTRQLFTGSGKVGSENGRPEVDYQITQRADFFEEEVGLETTLKRPIINTRDEPHGDPAKYRRFHVIIGDANRSHTQIFLKVGVTALFLAALEDRALPDPVALADPVEACGQVSRHPFSSLRLDGGGSATALEIQMRYLEWLQKYAERELDEEMWRRVLGEWERILVDLERDPEMCADRLDWVAKKRLLDAYVERDGLSWDSDKLKAIDLLYHDIDPARSMYQRLLDRGKMVRMFSDEELAWASTNPPEDTRAYFRGRCVSMFPDSLVSANWDSLVFDTGKTHLQRVPMMEPLRGDKSRVEDLLQSVEGPAELIEALGG